MDCSVWAPSLLLLVIRTQIRPLEISQFFFTAARSASSGRELPPIRYRRNIPTPSLEITLTEGRNRHVRRMTAAVGHPTMRLVSVGIGPWSLDGLRLGEWEIRR